MRKLKLQELNRVNAEEFKRQEKAPFYLILDNIRSGLNVGSAFRTADALAASGIYLCGITAQPPHREILKTAIGATESVNWQYRATTQEAIAELRADGIQIIGIEQTNESVLLPSFPYESDHRYALVFANEVRGISEEVLPLLDACIEVPQFGTKHSLNISVCLGVVLWDLFKRWKYKL